MKKYFWLIAGTTLGLFLIGLLMGPFVLQWTEPIIGEDIVGLTLSDFLVAPISLGSLLAFCSVCAGCLLWAYLRNTFEYPPQAVFAVGLLVSLVSATVSIGLNLVRFRTIFRLAGDNLDNIPLVMGAINYFSLGYGLTLIVNIIMIGILLWFSRHRQAHQNHNVPIHND